MTQIETGDIKFFLSGGSDNTDPNASLGGAISTTELQNNELHNLFAKVSAAEADTGSTKYRAIYIKNDNGHGLTLVDAIAYIVSQTTSGDTSVEIAVATEGKDTSVQVIANENTAPTGQDTWVSTIGTGNGQALTSLGDGEYRGIWVKRVVNASASAFGNDTCEIGCQGETTST